MKACLSQVALVAILLTSASAANPLTALPNIAGTWQFSVDLEEGSHGATMPFFGADAGLETRSVSC